MHRLIKRAFVEPRSLFGTTRLAGSMSQLRRSSRLQQSGPQPSSCVLNVGKTAVTSNHSRDSRSTRASRTAISRTSRRLQFKEGTDEKHGRSGLKTKTVERLATNSPKAVSNSKSVTSTKRKQPPSTTAMSDLIVLDADELSDEHEPEPRPNKLCLTRDTKGDEDKAAIERLELCDDDDEDLDDDDDECHDDVFPLTRDLFVVGGVDVHAPWMCGMCNYFNGAEADIISPCFCCGTIRHVILLTELPKHYSLWECLDVSQNKWQCYDLDTCLQLEEAFQALIGSLTPTGPVHAYAGRPAFSSSSSSSSSFSSSSSYASASSSDSLSLSSSAACRVELSRGLFRKRAGCCVQLSSNGCHWQHNSSLGTYRSVRRHPSRCDEEKRQQAVLVARRSAIDRLLIYVHCNRSTFCDTLAIGAKRVERANSKKPLLDGDPWECPICLEEFSLAAPPFALVNCKTDALPVTTSLGRVRTRLDANSGHYFHRSCITRWLERANNCPACLAEQDL